MTKRWDGMISKEVNGKNYWTKIGVAFENKSGNGFNVILEAIPPTVDGAYRISFFEPKENNNSGNSGGGNNGGSSYSSGRPGSNRGQSAPDHGQDDDIPF